MSEKEEQPVAKKLCSIEEDLKVIVGCGNKEEIRWYHAASLAAKSKVIDAMLATPMKEKDTRVIAFTDISPKEWDKIMKFIESPLAARRMTVRDAMEVARLYDHYEFSDGIALCDAVLEDFVHGLNKAEEENRLDIDLVVDAVVVAHEANLDAAFLKSMVYIFAKMRSSKIPYGRTMFTEHHLERMKLSVLKALDMDVPFIEEGDDLELTTEFFERPNFPSEFVHRSKNWHTFRTLIGFVSHLKLSGVGVFDGTYQDRETEKKGIEYSYDSYGTGVWWGDTNWKISIVKDEQGWAIVREEVENPERRIACWRSPCSANLPLPPKNGWKPVDPMVRGEPTITYVLEKQRSTVMY